VSELQSGFQVRILTPDDHVAVKTVTLGSRSGNRWIVEKGLKQGERVIVDGPSLTEGTAVKPQPASTSAEAH
jgi:membrane fusion protein, multidrug efflux system